MSNFDRIHLLRNAATLSVGGEPGAVSRVTVQVDDTLSYTAGDDTGRNLVVPCIFGSQAMAQDLLASVRGLDYQAFQASDTLIDPAAELGDAVTVNGTYGGLYSMRINFRPPYRADISAPEEAAIDHEYPYIPAQTKEIRRLSTRTKTELRILDDRITAEVSQITEDMTELSSALIVQADRITAEVSARQNDVRSLSASLSVQAGQIAAKVSATGGSASSVEWQMLPDEVFYKIIGTKVVSITKTGLKISGEIEALSGKIGGFNIMKDYLSYNGQTWGGTNTQGIYIGSAGIQLGRNFKVDNQGNLHAATGTFDGQILAGNIAYGDYAGYFNGNGLSTGSVRGGSGGKISGSSLSNFNMSGGINTSLGYADFANGVFNGWNSASNIYANSITAKSSLYIPYGGGTRRVSVNTVTINGHVYNILTI